MIFTHFTDSRNVKSIRKQGIKPHENYHGFGILLYPDINLDFRFLTSDVEVMNEEKFLNELDMDRKWEVNGALGLRQEGKNVTAIKLKSCEAFWPMKVFIDLPNGIAIEFQKNLDGIQSDDIQYLGTQSLAMTIANIKYERYVLESKFRVNTEEGLKEIIDCFIRAEGGLRGAHSFDCMIETDIESGIIEQFIEYP